MNATEAQAAENAHFANPFPISLGRIVLYALTELDASRINARRADAIAKMAFHGRERTGAIVHVGNAVAAGQAFPMIVTAMSSKNTVNGQVFLDGNDTFWITSAIYDDRRRDGTWSWPPRF